MKLFIITALLCLIPFLLLARDLSEAARRERARRASLEKLRPPASVTFKDADLEAYRRFRAESPSTRARHRPRTATPARDFEKERQYWHRKKLEHERELDRLDQRIRRLRSRLALRRASMRPGERLREDPTMFILEDQIRSLEDQRRHLLEKFRERGRKAGAHPGWLR